LKVGAPLVSSLKSNVDCARNEADSHGKQLYSLMQNLNGLSMIDCKTRKAPHCCVRHKLQITKTWHGNFIKL